MSAKISELYILYKTRKNLFTYFSNKKKINIIYAQAFISINVKQE